MIKCAYNVSAITFQSLTVIQELLIEEAKLISWRNHEKPSILATSSCTGMGDSYSIHSLPTKSVYYIYTYIYHTITPIMQRLDSYACLDLSLLRKCTCHSLQLRRWCLIIITLFVLRILVIMINLILVTTICIRLLCFVV